MTTQKRNPVYYLSFLVLGLCLSPRVVFAQLVNPTGIDNVFDLFDLLITEVLLPVAAVIAVVALIFAGFQFVAAMGNPDKLSKARKNLIYVLIGILLLLGAYAITQVIKTTLCEVVGVEVLCPIDTTQSGTDDGGTATPPPDDGGTATSPSGSGGGEEPFSPSPGSPRQHQPRN